ADGSRWMGVSGGVLAKAPAAEKTTASRAIRKLTLRHAFDMPLRHMSASGLPYNQRRRPQRSHGDDRQKRRDDARAAAPDAIAVLGEEARVLGRMADVVDDRVAARREHARDQIGRAHV